MSKNKTRFRKFFRKDCILWGLFFLSGNMACRNLKFDVSFANDHHQHYFLNTVPFYKFLIATFTQALIIVLLLADVPRNQKQTWVMSVWRWLLGDCHTCQGESKVVSKRGTHTIAIHRQFIHISNKKQIYKKIYTEDVSLFC